VLIYTFHFCTLVPKEASAAGRFGDCKTDLVHQVPYCVPVGVVYSFFQIVCEYVIQKIEIFVKDSFCGW
jgi:hypothetical protein